MALNKPHVHGNSRIEAHFVKEGFERSNYDHTLFIQTGDRGKIFVVSLYVDDLILLVIMRACLLSSRFL